MPEALRLTMDIPLEVQRAPDFPAFTLGLFRNLKRIFKTETGKMVRDGHLGNLNELMVLQALAGSEMAMRDLGIAVEPGSGVAAALEYYRATAKPVAFRTAAAAAAV
jgi:aspartate aminotransferase-like enzyme